MSSGRRTERLLNLVICLLHTRSYLPASRIRHLVPGYDEAASDEAFKRMFERDKEDLRDLGIPLEVGSFGAWDDDPGYRIRREDYALPPVQLEPDEAAAVGLAARMWSNATLSEAATRALRKLEAAGVEPAPLPDGLQPRADSGEAGFPGVTAALLEGRAIEFDYRGADDPAASRRHVEPWGVVWWRGRWYLAGHDRDRAAPRVFRLSRVVGAPKPVGPAGAVAPPPDVDVAEMVRSFDAGPETGETVARLRVRAGRGHDLRRTAIEVRAATDAEPAAAWDVVTLPCRDPERLAQRVLPFGADVVVLDPPELRTAVVERLKALI
jgi:proteasome accessory factor B